MATNEKTGTLLFPPAIDAEDLRYESFDEWAEVMKSSGLYGPHRELLEALEYTGMTAQQSRHLSSWHFGYRPDNDAAFEQLQKVYQAAVTNGVFSIFERMTIAKWKRRKQENHELMEGERRRSQLLKDQKREPTENELQKLVMRGRDNPGTYRSNVQWAADNSSLTRRQAVKDAPNNHAFKFYELANEGRGTKFWSDIVPKVLGAEETEDDDLILKKDKKDIKELAMLIREGRASMQEPSDSGNQESDS